MAGRRRCPSTAARPRARRWGPDRVEAEVVHRPRPVRVRPAKADRADGLQRDRDGDRGRERGRGAARSWPSIPARPARAAAPARSACRAGTGSSRSSAPPENRFAFRMTSRYSDAARRRRPCPTRRRAARPRQPRKEEQQERRAGQDALARARSRQPAMLPAKAASACGVTSRNGGTKPCRPPRSHCRSRRARSAGRRAHWPSSADARRSRRSSAAGRTERRRLPRAQPVSAAMTASGGRTSTAQAKANPARPAAIRPQSDSIAAATRN